MPNNPLANPDNWTLAYIESMDEHQWVYIGLDVQPWLVAQELSRA